MKKNGFNLKLKDKYQNLFFLLFLLIGLLSFKDYGISWDEKMSRGVGFLNGKYVLEEFFTESYQEIISKNDTEKVDKLESYDLKTYPERAYGVSFELPLALVEFLSNIKEIDKVFHLRHLINFLVFFISSIFFYKLLINLGHEKLVALLGFGILVTTPRIFAESFYNSKDIIFMSYMILSHYFGNQLIAKNKLSNLIFFCFFTALSAGLRIIGLANLFFYIFILILKKKKINFFYNLKLISLTLLILYLIWPFLWEKPIDNFLYVVNFFSHVPWQGGKVFYLGNFYESDALPWHYTIVWIAITTPIFYVILFFLSVIILIRNISNLKFDINKLFLLYLLLPITLVIILRPVQIDGWRHFYFLYPVIIIITLSILKVENQKLKKFIKFMIILNITYISFWNLINHPYQYLYFNNFFSFKSIKYFEKDYWGLSNKKLIEEVLKIDDTSKIYYKNYNSNFVASLDIFPREISSKFININNLENIDRYYIFINNRFFNQDRIEKITNDKKIIKEFYFNNAFINGVYLKENNK